MSDNLDYLAFLRRKIKLASFAGFEIADDEINPILKPHQRACVKWAVRGGNRALFERFGLGKSVQQLEIVRLVMSKAGGPGLIVCPLGVRQEFKRDGEMLGIQTRFIRRTEEVDASFNGIHLTNYESIRDGRLDPNVFTVASLDEASVLRSYGSKTYQEFLPLFSQVRFKFVATATPSPNRYKELIHYAGFLGIMDTGQALTRFFQRDSTKANNLTLYPHKEREFWLWLNSWAIFLQKPSDLGYSDDGYDLPPMAVHYHEVGSDHATAGTEKDGQGLLFRDAAIGLRQAASEKRDSLPARIECLQSILSADPDSHYLIWHHLEDERHAIKAAVPEAVSVWGSQDLDQREQAIVDFSNGAFKYLSTKPEIAGSGCNFQRHCHKAVFLGINYSFNDFIQAVHRIFRFLQTREVEIHIIHSEAEREIVKTLQEKWIAHEKMVENMSAIIKEYGLNEMEMAEVLARTIGVERLEVASDRFTVANNDCVVEARLQPESSVDLIVTSIPFANHYEYTPSYNDFGHTEDNDHFWEQMDFLTPELLRILQPGRLYCCHVKDRIQFGNVTGAGAPTVSPFHCEAIMHARKHGFDYMGMITVVTDVVRENNQTYRLGWSEQCKDGTKMGVGSPEYVLLFRKPQTDRSRGYADLPVSKSKADYTRARWQVDAHAFWRSSGNRQLTAEDLASLGPDKLAKAFTAYSLSNTYDYDFHIRIGEELEARGALPSSFMSLAPGSHDPGVWHDINRMLTLNGSQTQKGLQNHVCLARGSLVLTRRGFVPIQDVKVGDLVLTHEGRWKAVQVVANTGARPVVDFRAQGVAALALTPEHKVWARKSNWARSRDGAERASPEWVRADEMVGGYVNLKLPPVEDSTLTNQECWILGRWLADGHRGVRGDFYVSVGPDKLAEFERMAGEHAGTRAVRTAVQFRLKALRHEMIEALNRCGSGAGEKQVPAELLSLNAEKARALLDGYLSGDGHFVSDRGTWMATSISRALLLGMAILAQRVHGTVASLRAGRKAGTKTIDGREVKTRQEWVLSFDAEGARRKAPFILDDGAWKKVRSADPAGEMETWCLRVEEDASFTAEGCIVANCPLQFDIVDRLIERYSNPGETVYDPFGGLMTVPYRAILKGRKGRASELNTAYFFDGVQYLRAAEREVSMPSLFDGIELEEAA